MPPPSALATEAASAAASFALPSFVLPSSDKALEALIPDQFCGTKPLKGSLTGDQVFAGSTKDAAVVAALQSMGKTKADVSAAFGITTSTDCGVAIIRVNGANESDLKRVFLAGAASSGTTYTEDSVGGKAVRAHAERLRMSRDTRAIIAPDNSFPFCHPDSAVRQLSVS